MTGRVRVCGDSALVVELGEGLSPAVQRRVLGLRDRLAGLVGVVALVPAYRSLFVQYDPREVSFEALSVAIEGMIDAAGERAAAPSRRVEIPVCYDPALGPDLEEVARLRGLNAAAVAELHSGPTYTVSFLGFTPGFAFLSGLDPRLHAPRLPEPRTHVPAGSVGIGGAQTGVYAVASPGGWRLLGRTPLRLFDAARAEPALLRAGDRVRFRPITREEFRRFGGEP